MRFRRSLPPTAARNPSHRSEDAMTVSELITLLRTFPGDAPAGVLTVAQSGLLVDIDTAPVLTVEQTVADDGTGEAVGLTGVGETAGPAPTFIPWPCNCGEVVT